MRSKRWIAAAALTACVLLAAVAQTAFWSEITPVLTAFGLFYTITSRLTAQK